MQGTKLFVVAIVALGLAACGKNANSTNSGDEKAEPTPTVKMLDFVTTQDGKPLEINPAQFVTPAAKEFLATGKDSYIGDSAAIARGQKIFDLYSCYACHGATAEGAIGPSLHGPGFQYLKDATNKGMFETLWHGTNGGMGAKGKGLMDPADSTTGLSPDDVLKVIAWIRSFGSLTGNE